MSTPIIWQKKKVNLIILVLMPINANENDKNTIRNFMKCLANEDYIIFSAAIYVWAIPTVHAQTLTMFIWITPL